MLDLLVYRPLRDLTRFAAVGWRAKARGAPLDILLANIFAAMATDTKRNRSSLDRIRHDGTGSS